MNFTTENELSASHAPSTIPATLPAPNNLPSSLTFIYYLDAIVLIPFVLLNLVYMYLMTIHTWNFFLAPILEENVQLLEKIVDLLGDQNNGGEL